jgi:nucleoside-diphosphate kinase
MSQKTCLIIKPDGVAKKVVGRIIDRFESEGFALANLRMILPNRALIETLYKEHRGKSFYKPLLKFIMSGPIVAMAWEGRDVIGRVRKIIGNTDSKKAAPGTIRWLWGTDNRRNVVHASDSPASARREASLLFNDPPGKWSTRLCMDFDKGSD